MPKQSDDSTAIVMNTIMSQLDKMYDKLGNIDSTLSGQAVTLQEHTRRSLALEASVELLRSKAEDDKMTLGERLAPLETHVIQANFFFKATTYLTIFSGGTIAVIKLFLFLSSIIARA